MRFGPLLLEKEGPYLIGQSLSRHQNRRMIQPLQGAVLCPGKQRNQCLRPSVKKWLALATNRY